MALCATAGGVRFARWPLQDLARTTMHQSGPDSRSGRSSSSGTSITCATQNRPSALTLQPWRSCPSTKPGAHVANVCRRRRLDPAEPIHMLRRCHRRRRRRHIRQALRLNCRRFGIDPSDPPHRRRLRPSRLCAYRRGRRRLLAYPVADTPPDGGLGVAAAIAMAAARLGGLARPTSQARGAILVPARWALPPSALRPSGPGGCNGDDDCRRRASCCGCLWAAKPTVAAALTAAVSCAPAERTAGAGAVLTA